MAATAVATAQAEDGIYIPLMSYRTGPYSGAGAAIFNGMSDYLNMLNARDGGVGGARLIVEECETGYDTKKGVECYDSTKGKNPVVSTPYSTGITLQLIPKAAVDKIPILSDYRDGLVCGRDGGSRRRTFHRGDMGLHRLLHLLESAHLDLAHALARHAKLVGELFQRDRPSKVPPGLESQATPTATTEASH